MDYGSNEYPSFVEPVNYAIPMHQPLPYIGLSNLGNHATKLWVLRYGFRNLDDLGRDSLRIPRRIAFDVRGDGLDVFDRFRRLD